MVTMPALVWRGGFGRRALTIGGCVGLCLGALAWLDSGFLLSGVIVMVAVGTFYGTWMARRMDRYWPGAKALSRDERVAVVRAVRRGDNVDDSRLADPQIEYARGLCAAAEEARPLRWVLVVLLVVALVVAVWDALVGSWGSAVASVIYLVALLVELFWWPKLQSRLLARARRRLDSNA